jgi:hypothetical protein
LIFRGVLRFLGSGTSFELRKRQGFVVGCSVDGTIPEQRLVRRMCGWSGEMDRATTVEIRCWVSGLMVAVQTVPFSIVGFIDFLGVIV